MKTKKQWSTVLFACIIFFSAAFLSCSLVKSDEQKITERIERFETCYNNGDLEGVVSCLATKERKNMQATLNVYQTLFGSLVGFELNLSDLFSLGVAIQDAEAMRVEIDEIRLTSTVTATVEGLVVLRGTETEDSPTWFYMVKEDDEWFIRDIIDAPEADEYESVSAEK